VTLPPPAEPLRVRWRYHFTDFRRGILLATLPMTGVSLSEVLSGAAAGQGSVPLNATTLRRDPFAATVPRRCCCWAERQTITGRGQVIESAIMWGGVVIGREASLSARALRLALVSWPGYLQRRLVGHGVWRQADKADIMGWLLSEGFRQPEGYEGGPWSPHHERFNLVLNAPDWQPFGVLADRTYLATDSKPVLEAARELSSSGDGFDWRLVPYLGTPGDLRTLQVRADLGFPRLGRIEPPELRWSTDRADARQRWGYVSDLGVAEAGDAVNNRITAVGAGTGEDQIRATVEGAAVGRDELADGWPLYEGALGSSSQEDRTFDTVYGKAIGALLAGFAGAVKLSGIKVRGDLPPVVTSYEVGDDATVKIDRRLLGRPLTIVGQITGRTIEPAERGRVERVTLDVQGAVA
jgi:hypothetical protein